MLREISNPPKTVPTFNLSETAADEGVSPNVITEEAAGMPGVVWASMYWPSFDGLACRLAAQSGDLPAILEDFALPLDRLPPPVVRAVLKGSVQHGRFSVLWLQQETKREVSSADLERLNGLVAIPLHVGFGQNMMLLVGTVSREPELATFEEFRTRMERRFSTVDRVTQAESELLRSEALQLEVQRLARNSSLFKARLAIEFDRTRRYRRQLSLMTFTLQGLPDYALARYLDDLARTLRLHLRLPDVVGRADYHTIGVMLPETGGTHALWAVPRLRAAAHTSLTAASWLPEMTIGLADRPLIHETPDDFVARAMRSIVPQS